MTNKNDIELAIALAEAETGVTGGVSLIPLCSPDKKINRRNWNEKEKQFLRDNHGRISDMDISKHLHRSLISVRLQYKREMHLTAMSKTKEILTAEQISIGLGCDGKTVHLLIDTGLMPGYDLPSERKMRVVNRITLVKWLLDENNWIYFKPLRVGTMRMRGLRKIGDSYDFVFWENVRKLILKAHAKWNDQWLTPGQVVKSLNINPKATNRRKQSDCIPGVRYVNNAIRLGTLKATRWGNWWIKKSDLPQNKTINYKGNIVHV